MTTCCPVIPEQRGGATLLVALALIIASLALALALGHSSALEQRMARNSLLAEQTRQAAQAGLNYGLAALQNTRPAWLPAPNGEQLASPAATPPLLASHTGDSFALNITYRRDPRWQGYVLLASSAAPASDPAVEVQVSQFVRPLGVLTAAGEDAPPLRIDGCVDLSATHDIFPQAADDLDAGPALLSSGPLACHDLSGVNLHGGTAHSEAFEPGPQWDSLFTLSRDEFQALTATQADRPLAQRDYVWASPADLTSGAWRTSLGSAAQPVVLVIPAALGCPAFSGGAEIVGLVYIEADCTGGPAWGDVRIYGSLVLQGDVAQLGPYTRLLHISHAPGAPPRIEPPPRDVLRLTGTWRDF